MGNKIIRLTESDLQNLVGRTTRRIIKEGNDVKLAQEELHKMGSSMSSIGLRLQGTKYEPLYQKMKSAIVELYNALIADLRKE